MAPNPVRVRCPAKINLGLWILGQRNDGYHDVDTVLQSVTLEDELLLAPGAHGFSLETRGIRIPQNGPNLVERAWELVAERASRAGFAGIHAVLMKRIPVGAGLGGGSSDAAGFLAGTNRLFGLGLTKIELAALGARLGADIPFFFRGGTARAVGRGDQLRQLCPIDPFWAVLVSPPFAISTTWAYGRFRKKLTPRFDGATVLASAIAGRNWNAIEDAMYNVFEDVALPEFPGLAVLKRAIIGCGAAKVLLSGSGSTLYGVVHSRDEAMAVARGMADRGTDVRVVRALGRGITVVPRG